MVCKTGGSVAIIHCPHWHVSRVSPVSRVICQPSVTALVRASMQSQSLQFSAKTKNGKISCKTVSTFHFHDNVWKIFRSNHIIYHFTDTIFQGCFRGWGYENISSFFEKKYRFSLTMYIYDQDMQILWKMDVLGTIFLFSATSALEAYLTIFFVMC